MGLDIRVLRQLSPVPPREDGDPDSYYLHVQASADFPGRTAPLADGWYEYDDPVARFRAGSYTGYNDWREWLAKLAGYPAVSEPDDKRHDHSRGAWAATGGPFWELIHFYDNEGVIGTAVAAKLAGEFVEWADRAKAAARHGWDLELYRHFRDAFELAADGGAVEFC